MAEQGFGCGGVDGTPPLDDLLTGATRSGPQVDLDDEGEPFGERWSASVADLLADMLKGTPGGLLAAAMEDATSEDWLADLPDGAVVDLAAGAQRLMGWAMGVQLVAVAELARRREHTPGGVPPSGEWVDGSFQDLGHRAAVNEIALASGLSEYAVSARLHAAMMLPNRLPRVWAALTSGGLDWAKVTDIVRETTVLSDEQVARVEADILRVAASSNVPLLRKWLKRMVQRVDPQGCADRARDAQKRRALRFSAGPDATATLALTASAATISAAEAALTRLANASIAGLPDDDPAVTSPATTRADVLLDLIHSADDALTEVAVADASPADQPGPRRPARRDRTRTLLTMPLSTMLGLNEEPAELSGYGTIPALMAREIAASGTWVCAVTDDRPGHAHGTLLGLGRSTYSPTYTPKPSTWEFVSVRDGTCRVPGCNRPSRACDLDHRIPWSAPDDVGGPRGVTCECDLEALCGNHHRLKHEAGFTLTRTRRGSFLWTTPTGYAYRQPPEVLPHAPMDEPAPF